jgi:putative sugar O-methyltransferase
MKKFGFRRRASDALMRRVVRLSNGKGSRHESPYLPSDSQLTKYEQEVGKILRSKSKWRNFRSRYHYRIVLEHVDPIHGREYLNTIKESNPKAFDVIQEIKKNDKIGNPALHKYQETGYISPTTLRYLSVATQLGIKFNQMENFRIAEIGIGYGGQIRILDELFEIKEFVGFDLSDVQLLAGRYLQSYPVKCEISFPDIAQFKPRSFDLIISNYAFSELPESLQREYIQKILKFSRHGYLTMNSGLPEFPERNQGKMLLAELLMELPDARVEPETPLTSNGNYLIVW